MYHEFVGTFLKVGGSGIHLQPSIHACVLGEARANGTFLQSEALESIYSRRSTLAYWGRPVQTELFYNRRHWDRFTAADPRLRAGGGPCKRNFFTIGGIGIDLQPPIHACVLGEARANG